MKKLWRGVVFKNGKNHKVYFHDNKSVICCFMEISRKEETTGQRWRAFSLTAQQKAGTAPLHWFIVPGKSPGTTRKRTKLDAAYTVGFNSWQTVAKKALIFLMWWLANLTNLCPGERLSLLRNLCSAQEAGSLCFEFLFHTSLLTREDIQKCETLWRISFNSMLDK